MLKASTPINPISTSTKSSSLKLSSSSTLLSPSLERSRAVTGGGSPTSSLDSPPISSFAKRYRATPLPTPTAESTSSPFTPLSSAGATPSTISPNAVHSEDEEEEEVSLVRRTSGKGFRVQENVRRGSSRRSRAERSGSSSSAEERRKSAAQKVEDSRIKVKAARKMEEQLAQGIQAREIPSAKEGGEEEGDGGEVEPPTLSSYSKDMQSHMAALMAKLEGLSVGGEEKV